MNALDRYQAVPQAIADKGAGAFIKSARTADVVHVEKAASGKGGKITLRISTEDIDRANDKMILAGAQLDSYLKNPVVQWAHDGDIPAVARSLSISTNNGAMESVADFHGLTELSIQLYNMYAGGYLKATSIGFIPLSYQDLKDVPTAYPFTSCVRQYDTWELLEYSCCNVPMNQGAVMGDGSKAFLKSFRKALDEGALKSTDELFTLLMAEYMDDARRDMAQMRKAFDEIMASKSTIITPMNTTKAKALDQAAAEDLTNQIIAFVKPGLQTLLTKAGYDFNTADLQTVASDCAEDVIELLNGVSDEPAEPAAAPPEAPPAQSAVKDGEAAAPTFTDQLGALQAFKPLHEQELAIAQAALALPQIDDDVKDFFTGISEDTPGELDEVNSLIETYSQGAETQVAPEGKTFVTKRGAKHSAATLKSLMTTRTHAKNCVKEINNILRAGTADPNAEAPAEPTPKSRIRLEDTDLFKQYTTTKQ